MKELSLNILDIAQNSIKAGATLVQIHLTETEELLTLCIADDGCGMTEEVLKGVVNPFYTTRTTRKVGLGLPFLKLTAEQTGGEMKVSSRHESEHPENHGTEVVASFFKRHIDFTPLGDIGSTVLTLIQGNPSLDFHFLHTMEENEVVLDTRQLREILGEDIPLNSPEILDWIKQYINEQYQHSKNNN